MRRSITAEPQKGSRMLKITRLQRFSVHDGPGIRTSVFCKGCSLRCFWCHNPETIEPDIRLWYSKEQCISCGSCKRSCPKGLFYGEEGCDCTQESGFYCAQACPSGALAPTGERIELLARQDAGRDTRQDARQDTLLEQLLRDVSYYRRSGGGVTFSGGEPLLQARALGRIMALPGLSGISRAVDTAGNVPWDCFREVIPFTDLFLYDVKCMDNELHKKGTGAGNGLILENLERLCGTGAAVWIRIPVIPGWNDSESEMGAIAQRLRQLSDHPRCGIERIQLLPFHRFGKEKYARLGRDYPAEALTPPSGEKMKELLAVFQETGLVTAEIGNHSVLSGQK